MSAAGVADAAIEAVVSRVYGFILVNFANVDVIGHTRNPNAVILAVQTADRELGRVLEAARRAGMTAVVTADHGSAERWFYPDGTIDTGHTDSPVPFIVVPPQESDPVPLAAEGSLADAAPTILDLMGLPRPQAMTGRSLLGGALPGGPGPVIMVILDGWGLGGDPAVDLILGARTPVMDDLMKRLPMAGLAAAGVAVGMPPGTVGNSEAGHLHLGAGRVVASDRVRIDRAVADGSFFANEPFLAAMRGARERKAALHLIGIVSFYSSHGSLAHLLSLMDLARREGVTDLYVHGFLGRRGERPESGAIYAAMVEEHAAAIGLGRLATVIGRFWSLDREGRWDRIAKTWRLLVKGEGRPVTA
jgi:2,3-bisphosphoglycerate-independent phosphoglycerate mutase